MGSIEVIGESSRLSTAAQLCRYGDFMIILDHIGSNVSDFALSKKFYLQALESFGIGIISEGQGWAMIGKDGKGQF
jgi:hypothetical protein